MSDKTKKILGIAGAGGVVAGTILMLISGADAQAATGIVGLAAGAFAAVVALINGLKK